MVSSSSDSSTSTIPNVFENIFPKSHPTTTIKLNGSNYLLWTQSFKALVGAQRKMIKHIFESPLYEKDIAI